MELLRKNLVLIGIVAIVILGGIWYSLSAGGSEGTIEVTEGGVLQQTEGDPEAAVCVGVRPVRDAGTEVRQR